MYLRSFLYFFCKEEEIEFLGEFMFEKCGIELDLLWVVILFVLSLNLKMIYVLIFIFDWFFIIILLNIYWLKLLSCIII